MSARNELQVVAWKAWLAPDQTVYVRHLGGSMCRCGTWDFKILIYFPSQLPLFSFSHSPIFLSFDCFLVFSFNSMLRLSLGYESFGGRDKVVGFLIKKNIC